MLHALQTQHSRALNAWTLKPLSRSGNWIEDYLRLLHLMYSRAAGKGHDNQHLKFVVMVFNP